MAEKRTYVKRIIVGRPVASINEAASGVVVGTGRQFGSILVNKTSSNLYEPGELLAGHGLDKSYGDSASNNIVLSLDSSELKAIIDSDYVAFVMGQSTSRNFVDSAYVEQNSLDSERGLNLFRSDLAILNTSIIPLTDSTVDLGSESKKFRKLFLSGKTIKLGALNLSDSGGNFVVRDSDNNNTKIDLSANSTNDLLESDNLYYTRARFDSALGDTTSISTIRGYLNLVDAGGDGSLAYDSARGQLTYTGPSASEVRAHINVVDAGGDGSFTYDSATGQLTYTGPSASEVRAHMNIVDAGGDGSFAYDSARGQFTYTGPSASEVRAHVSATDAGGDGSFSFDAGTGVFTYTGPSASEVRSHFSGQGDLTYDSSTGVFSIDVENVYTQANFESDLSLHLSATNGLSYDSNTHQLTIANTGVDSATYGSATRVPVLTINAQGQVDSAGSVLVAGVTGFALDSARGVLTISTADGGSFEAAIHGRDSGVITDISGSTINYASGNIGQLTSDSARFTVLTSPDATIDSAVITNLSGTSINFGSTQFADLLADSAKIGNMTVTGDLTVSGTQTTINTQILKVTDPIIHLADSNITTDIVDLGFVGKYYRDGQQRHTGLVRDASNEQYYLFRDVVDSSLDSSLTINRSATGFAKADLNVASLNADSATMTNLTVTGLSTTSLTSTTLSRAATVDSATYGSATLIPRLTVNASGFIDSIGEVLVAGVTGLTYDSNTESITISTADGGSFATHIGGFKNIDVDSANVFNITGSNIHYDSGFIGQFSTDSAHISQLDTTVVRAGGILADSGNYTVLKIGGAHVNTEMFTDSAYVLGRIEALSLDSERTINLIRNDALFVDSAYIEQNSLDSERTIALIDSDYLRGKVKVLEKTIIIQDSDNGAGDGPDLILRRNSVTPAASDLLGALQFEGRDAGLNNTIYGNIFGSIDDASEGSEDGAIFFGTQKAGSLTNLAKLSSTKLELLNSTGLDIPGALTLAGETVDSAFVNLRVRELTNDQLKLTLSENGAAAGPTLILDRNSTSAADSDALAAIEFRGRNDAGSPETIAYAKITSHINDMTDGEEDAELHFTLTQAGVNRTKMKLAPTGIVLAGNEKISFSDDSFAQILTPGNYTSNHTLTLPDSTGTILTREFVSNIIDSDYIGARQSATGLTLDFDDSAGATLVSLTITQAPTIATGSVIGFGNTVTVLDTDSAEVTISL